MKTVVDVKSIQQLVSVVLPVYNSAATLETAIRSILNQSYPEWELLILDDGSQDETVDIARSYASPQVRMFSDGAHQGLAARLNQGIRLSRGKYFARMDADDVSYPARLVLQVKYLDEHPDVDLVGGGVLIFGRDGKALGSREIRVTHEEICQRPWAGFYLAHPTWMGRIEWFRRFWYRRDAVRCEDQDLLLRSYESSRFASLPQIVLGYSEPELTLPKLLRGRKSFLRSVAREAAAKRKYSIGLFAFLEQCAKAATDCLAVGTGLNYRILRHRARPVNQTEKDRWAKVWSEVHTGMCPDERHSVVAGTP